MEQMSEVITASEVPSSDRAVRALLPIVLVCTIVGGAIDLYLDAPESWLSPHALYEIGLIVIAMLTSVLFWRAWWQSRRNLVTTRRMLVERAAERDAWKASAETALAGLGEAIDARFSAWALTAAEREVALLLLKGHSHKQIAFATGRSERTVRQHAVAVYNKSGLAGRAELAAFFLEDLMLP
jgi:DNA-binding CsgD family transcriptional regulator